MKIFTGGDSFLFFQGRFVDGPKYKYWQPDMKTQADREERHLVRYGRMGEFTGNAVCHCAQPEIAEELTKILNSGMNAIKKAAKSKGRAKK